MGQWSILGNTLYDATQSFGNHVREISGTQVEDKVLTLQSLYGNTVIQNASVNVSSFTVVANTSMPVYPIVKIGDTIVINNLERTVVGKIFEPTGNTVNYDVSTASTIIYSNDLQQLNLASIRLKSGVYINVNSEIKQVESINALGDFLTVLSPLRFSNTEIELNIETGFVVDTAFETVSTDQTLRIKSEFVANSICLGNVITGNGTTFTDSLVANNKVYYDEKEYYVLQVTDTEIVVDQPLRALNEPQRIFKVADETPVQRVIESNSPDDILAMFDEIDQLSTNLNASLSDGFQTRYRKSDGTYATIDAAKPVHVTQSLQRADILNAVNRTLQRLLDELQNDAIRELSESELVSYLEEITDELDLKRQELVDSVKQDLSAINAVKGMLKGMLKLFQSSCSKKKKGDDPENPDDSSDQYLNLILSPNPLRQGCDATINDLPDILDQADTEYKEFLIPPVDPNDNIPSDYKDLPDLNDVQYQYRPQTAAGGNGDVGVDNEPDLGTKPVDPCTQPC